MMDDLIKQYPVGTKVQFRRYSKPYTGTVMGHTVGPKTESLLIKCDQRNVKMKVQTKMVTS